MIEMFNILYTPVFTSACWCTTCSITSRRTTYSTSTTSQSTAGTHDRMVARATDTGYWFGGISGKLILPDTGFLFASFVQQFNWISGKCNRISGICNRISGWIPDIKTDRISGTTLMLAHQQAIVCVSLLDDENSYVPALILTYLLNYLSKKLGS